jgi:hypothetical protein
MRGRLSHTSNIEPNATGVLVQLNTPFRQRNKQARQSAIMQRFAETRRNREDVFWLKENAEILNVFDASGFCVPDQALSVYAGLYSEIEARIGFFPQYYRFFLSLCLDLEDLGMPGDKGEELVAWVAQAGLVQAELSDLQRAEARRLCQRRGIDPLIDDQHIDDRLRRFTERSDTFTLPNKKAAYELTHIIFYLSEYGRKDPQITQATCDSLHHAGTLAFLELNIDLLSEICIALRFAGLEPPSVWERWLRDQVRRFSVHAAPEGAGHDDYHPWLMLNWFMEVSGQGGFGHEMPEGGVAFVAPKPSAGPLRELSDTMYKLGDDRCADWTRMRDNVGETLSDASWAVLQAAEEAVDFDAFFRGFARAARPGFAGGMV